MSVAVSKKVNNNAITPTYRGWRPKFFFLLLLSTFFLYFPLLYWKKKLKKVQYCNMIDSWIQNRSNLKKRKNEIKFSTFPFFKKKNLQLMLERNVIKNFHNGNRLNGSRQFKSLNSFINVSTFQLNFTRDSFGI